MFKFNWDLASDKINKKTRIGSIIRDSEGMVIGILRISKRYIDCPFRVEALALYHAAQFCRDIGLTHLIT